MKLFEPTKLNKAHHKNANKAKYLEEHMLQYLLPTKPTTYIFIRFQACKFPKTSQVNNLIRWGTNNTTQNKTQIFLKKEKEKKRKTLTGPGAAQRTRFWDSNSKTKRASSDSWTDTVPSATMKNFLPSKSNLTIVASLSNLQ